MTFKGSSSQGPRGSRLPPIFQIEKQQRPKLPPQVGHSPSSCLFTRFTFSWRKVHRNTPGCEYEKAKHVKILSRWKSIFRRPCRTDIMLRGISLAWNSSPQLLVKVTNRKLEEKQLFQNTVRSLRILITSNQSTNGLLNKLKYDTKVQLFNTKFIAKFEEMGETKQECEEGWLKKKHIIYNSCKLLKHYKLSP